MVRITLEDFFTKYRPHRLESIDNPSHFSQRPDLENDSISNLDCLAVLVTHTNPNWHQVPWCVWVEDLSEGMLEDVFLAHE